jgi:tetraacyldisaccharide 4'-kinase
MNWFSSYLSRGWYEPNLFCTILSPLGVLHSIARTTRNLLYDLKVLKVEYFSVPVVVVGNITAGGTGKTPLVIQLVNDLRARGYCPGVVTRGYGSSGLYPAQAQRDSDPKEVGDEAVLIARRTGAPVIVDPDRVNAVAALLEQGPVDLVLSDDGLQHTRLGRCLEIVVFDGEREFGNGKLLPAGPLRDPVERLETVDLVVRNGGVLQSGEFAMKCLLGEAVNILSGERRNLGSFTDRPVVAVAGIGNPQKFFSELRDLGLEAKTIAFPDHHSYTGTDLEQYAEQTVLMTEKDSLKCEGLAGEDWWWVDLCIDIDAQLTEQVLHAAEKFRANERRI